MTFLGWRKPVFHQPTMAVSTGEFSLLVFTFFCVWRVAELGRIFGFFLQISSRTRFLCEGPWMGGLHKRDMGWDGDSKKKQDTR